ncbi:hypothetical protein NL489_30360, partial [Klebsiella pneumoniae]|nr:hypothetical protein [Klebsiella pneumoniae]
IEIAIKSVKEKEFPYLIDIIQKWMYVIEQAFISLKEYLSPNFRGFNEYVQTAIQEASYKLQQVHQYIMALREEYFDP